MSNIPKVGIIFLTYPTANWERDIDRCLSSMEKLTYPKDRLELICVGSAGKRAPVKAWFDQHWMPKSEVTLPRITYISRDEQMGFAPSNNLGFEKAKELGCEYVHLTNEDTDVEPDYIDRAVARAEADPKIAYVQSLILLGEERDKVNTVGNAFHILGFGYSHGYRWTNQQALDFFEAERKTNPDLEIGYASGAAVLGRVSAIDACGGLFDEKFYSYHEDTDASLQARMRGWKTVVEPTSVIHHYYEFAKGKINYYWMERNRYVLMFSYYRWWTLFLLAPLIVIEDVAETLFSIKNGWWDMKWRVCKDFCSPTFWKWVMERRRKIQAARVISDAEFLKQAVATISFQEEHVQNWLLEEVGNPIMNGYWSIVRRLL